MKNSNFAFINITFHSLKQLMSCWYQTLLHIPKCTPQLWNPISYFAAQIQYGERFLLFISNESRSGAGICRLHKDCNNHKWAIARTFAPASKICANVLREDSGQESTDMSMDTG